MDLLSNQKPLQKVISFTNLMFKDREKLSILPAANTPIDKI